MSINENYYNLTHPQKRIWYIDKINSNSPLHNIGGCLKINENINIDMMKEAIEITIMKNDGIRLRFTEKEGQPIQYVHSFEKENIDFLDFSKHKNPVEEYEKWAQYIFRKNFSLENSKLYYFAIYKISEKQYGILLNIHHIISDGWSISIIQKQICEIYSNLINRKTIQFNDCYSYIDFIEDEVKYLNSDRFKKNTEFWKEKFDNIPEECLYRTSNSLEGNRKSYNIDEQLSKKINKFITNKNCSLNSFFIEILLIYLNKTTYKNDLIIGTPVFNRTDKKQKGIVGMFASTVPFRFIMNPELSLEGLIKLINKELKYCFFNQKYPYDLLIKDLDLGKEGYDSLFKISVNYYNSKYTNDINGVNVEVEECYCGNQSYSLQITIKEWKDNNITLNYDYKIREYSSEEIQIMYDSMINIIEQIISEKNLKVKDISILNKQERDYKIYELNSTDNYYPSMTVCKLFEEQVNLTPNKIAIEFEEKLLTYKGLNEKSNQLANYLRNNGVNKESIVGIMMTHSIELIIGILGILKAGAAYMPIDPNYPIERVNYMLQDSRSSMLLINFKTDSKIKFRSTTIIDIRQLDLKSFKKENLVAVNGIKDLVYIIYTSGSTGKPKGVMIEHSGLVNYLWWAKKMYLKDEDEVVALYSSISFDLTVTSIFTPLISGNKIMVYGNDENELVLYKILKENKTTVVKLTPAHLTLLKDTDNKNSKIRRFIVGGDDLKVNLAKEIYNSFNDKLEIYNEYGPTETVVGCMIHEYDKEMDNRISVPIGRPADNVQVYILDKELNLVPQGVIGELYISGEGVARGYLNREDLTYERFIENPFIKGKRMYKTGDTARYLKDGIIEYIGRIDDQVKIRGYRIELGEIEKHLLENEFVEEAVVVIKEDRLGNKVLNAYIVIKKVLEDLELKKWLMKFLPKYMIPTNFIFLEQMPLTVNGKIDYNLLPDPKLSKKEFVQHKTDVEKKLVEAMEEILGVKNIGMNDNYYQLGGDSIKAIQISSRLKNVELEVKVKDILSYDSIKEIAATIEICSSKEIINQEMCIGEIYNTPILDWFFNQGFSNNNLYDQYVFLEFNNLLDSNNVTKAINKLTEHHDTLRVNYSKKNNRLFYNNEHLNHQYQVEYHDLSKYSDDKQQKLIKNINDEAKSKFDIESSRLFNLIMFNLGRGRQALLFTAHHIIVDGVSWRILINDFLTILEQLENKEEISLPMKTHSFKEWSEQLQNYRKNDFQEEITYWKSIIDKNYTFPIDFTLEKDDVKTASVVVKKIDEELLLELIKKSNEVYSLELNELLIIALVLSIKSITKSEEILIELERHGREKINDYLDISRTIGWFTSMFPAYFKVNSTELDSNIKSIKEQLRSIPNKGFNYGILRHLNYELEENSSKRVRFNYLGDFDSIINGQSMTLNNIEFGLHNDENNSLTALIDITAMIVNKRLKISAEFSKNRFKDGTVEKFIDNYLETINLILECCINKSSKDFTPSDFDAVDISQDDLDALFI